jgi:hypothetical protein
MSAIYGCVLLRLAQSTASRNQENVCAAGSFRGHASVPSVPEIVRCVLPRIRAQRLFDDRLALRLMKPSTTSPPTLGANPG